MIPRHIESIVKKRFNHARSLYIFGARQVGKTTLVKGAFPDLPYVSLEDPDVEERAVRDPRGFLNHYKDSGAVLDELQRTPDVFRYLQGFIDEHKSKFVLSGSQNFLLNQQISQSLAGRVSFLEMMPLSQREIWQQAPLETEGFFNAIPDNEEDLYERLWSGGYPDPALDRDVASFWYGDYERTYLERDVRLLVNVSDLVKFGQFMRMVANRSGSLLNVANLSNDIGMSENGCRKWLAILEASGIIFKLLPYHKNYNKRLIKSPKVYFNDSGLLCYLLGLKKTEHLHNHAAIGFIFENYIISEFRKNILNNGEIPNLFFWRDKTGTEIDLIIEDGPNFAAFEIKKGETFTKDWLKNMNRWLKWSKSPKDRCHVIYGGGDSFETDGVKIIPWRAI